MQVSAVYTRSIPCQRGICQRQGGAVASQVDQYLISLGMREGACAHSAHRCGRASGQFFANGGSRMMNGTELGGGAAGEM